MTHVGTNSKLQWAKNETKFSPVQYVNTNGLNHHNTSAIFIIYVEHLINCNRYRNLVHNHTPNASNEQYTIVG